MYAFIIIGLVLSQVSLDLWAGGPAPDPAVTAAGAGAVAALVFLAGLGLSAYVLWRRAALAADERRFLRKVRALGKVYRLVVLAAYAAILDGLGWASLAAQAAGEWALPATALVLVPLVVLVALAWIAAYWADRALRAALFEQAGVVVVAGQWTLPRYLEFMFRQYFLVLAVPLVALVALDDLLTRVLDLSEEGLPAILIVLAATLGAFFLAGPWVRICWRTEPLPGGELRGRLEALLQRAGVRVAQILVWRTNSTFANGCMIGLAGPVRYIMITDALLLAMSQTPQEAEAVFAHEVGHVKYRHTLLYAGLALGGAGAALMAGEAAAALADSVWLANGAVGAVLLAYWGIGFGFVSRRCELEADLYAVRATECPVGCSPPDAGAGLARQGDAPPTGGQAVASPAAPAESGGQEWPVGPYAGGPCLHRVLVFTSALRRIARLNGAPETARGWRHFSVARRCAWLEALAGNPDAAAREERRLRRIKRTALALSLAIAAVAAACVLATAPTPSQTDHPEHPAGPEDIRPERPTWLVRLVDGNEVDVLAFRPPQFHRHADAAADLDDGRLAGLRPDAAPAHHDVAVADARGHAVAVDAQGKGPRPEGQARQVEVLDDPFRRGF
jgi:Zn-dependent protease with chaperone function